MINIKINGLEIEVPDGCKFEISGDGKKITVIANEVKEVVIEKIRIIEVPVQTQPYIQHWYAPIPDISTPTVPYYWPTITCGDVIGTASGVSNAMQATTTILPTEAFCTTNFN